MVGHVVALYIAPTTGAPMQALSTAHLVPGRGIVGDRFYARRASAPNTDTGQSDVTLVEQEALDALLEPGATAEAEASARRNIVVRGCTLHHLVGRRFCIGAVTLYGVAAPHLTCASPQPAQQDACAALTGTTLVCPGTRRRGYCPRRSSPDPRRGIPSGHGASGRSVMTTAAPTTTEPQYHVALSTTLRNGSPAAKRRALSNRI